MKVYNSISQHKIAANKMTEELSNLYSSAMPILANCILHLNELRQENYISYPYLIAPSQTYFESWRRIMILGQETNCWLGEAHNGRFCQDVPLEVLLNLYDLFSNNPHRIYNSPYWNLINLLQSIAEKNGSGIVTNNLAKVGFNKSTGYDPVANVEFDRIFREEIRICDPDVILFFTGPKYDSLIRQRLGCFETVPCIDSVAERKCAKLVFSEYPELEMGRRSVYRTYHPGYLQRVKNRFPWVNLIYEFLKEVAAGNDFSK